MEDLTMPLPREFIENMEPYSTGPYFTDWISIKGQLYRYARCRSSVGVEMIPGSNWFKWHLLKENNLDCATQFVLDMVRQTELED